MGVWTATLDGEVSLYVSPALKVIFGHAPEASMEDVSWWMCHVHPEDRALMRAEAERLREVGAAVHEYRIVRPNGEVRWVRDQARVLGSGGGGPTRLGGFVTDITEQRAAQEALARRETSLRATAERLSTLVANLQTGILVEDEHRRVLLANAHFCEAFSIDAPPEALAGADCAAAAEASKHQFRYPEAALARIEALLHAQQLVTAEEVEMQDGRVFERDFVPIQLDGRAGGHLWVYRDVTERRQVQAELLQRERLLQAVAAAMGRLLTDDLDAAIADAFQVLGTATGADRVCLFEVYDDPATGTCFASQRYEWAHDAVEPQIDNPELQDVPFSDVYARWHGELSAGRTVAGAVRDMPAGERALLEEQEIQSVLVVPIHLDGRFWGFIGFDDCRRPKAWSALDKATLTAAAGSVGRAILGRRDRAALRQSEERFRKLIQNSSDVVSILDAAGVIRYSSDSIGRALGYAPADLEGRSVYDYVHPEDRPALAAAFAALLAEPGAMVTHGFRGRHAEGHWIWAEAVATNLLHDPTIGGVLVNTRDATARRAAAAALEASERRYRSVVDNVRDVVFQTDAQGRWAFLNPAWTDVTGFPVEESLGRPVIDYVHPDDRPRSAVLFRRLVTGEQAHGRHEVRYRTLGRGTRWGEVYVTPIVDEDGRIVGTSGMLHDVTERREAMEALEQALERERELSGLKSRFASMASHELRTPLTAIRSSAELLGAFGGGLDAEQRRTLFERILSNVEVMNELIEDVLLLGRTDGGRLPFEPEWLDVGAFCDGLVREFQQSVGVRHRLCFTQAGGALEADADPKLLRHILSNLLSNAVKYSPEGSRIDLGLRPDGDDAVLVVRDRGIGIPKADQPRLFETFHRAANVGSRSGTGLGLTIAKRAVDLHGGTIRVETALGEGTTFTVRLPRHARGSDGAAAAPRTPDD